MTGQSEIDGEAFRDALSRFATGIAVVTTQDADRQHRAITINAFSSVSMEPPLVLYCLGRSAFNYETFASAPCFAVNLLSSEQEALSNRFAREEIDGLEGLETRQLESGAPVLDGCLAAIDCITHDKHDAGDHLIVVGHVVALQVSEHRATPCDPLVYFQSNYRRLKTAKT